MNAHLRACAFVAATAFALILLLALAGHWLRPQEDPRIARIVLGSFIGLTLLMAFALVPLLVRAFISLQGQIGNAELGPIRWLRAHENGITYGIWSLWLAGSLLAIPAMLRDMPEFAAASGAGPSQGLLVANIGMPLDEVRAHSTLPLGEGVYVKSSRHRMLIGDVVFDFGIAGSNIGFRQCRYYWIETYPDDDPRIKTISIGVSSHKVTRAQLVAAHEQLRAQLAADGWSPGQYNYRTPEQQQLHGGATSGGRGSYWRKGGTVLQLQGKRLDEEKPGEDPQTAGEWAQVIYMGPGTASSYEDLEFEDAER